jgi:2-dehydro-3-deoxyphosphogluconate aldolase/(4S)-4-hydroxy-2-oxoglutarate aldolase
MLQFLRLHPFIAIARGVPEASCDDLARALQAGGVRVLEVTLNSDGALATISRWRECFEGLIIGAGTVRNVQEMREAVARGAQFVVAPNTDEAVIEAALEAGVAVFPGALTPTEVARAYRLGATAVKVFPVSTVGGAAYIRDLRAPLNEIPLVAVGGVTPSNARSFLVAGAIAVGIGSALVNLEWIRDGAFDRISSAALELMRTLEVNRG